MLLSIENLQVSFRMSSSKPRPEAKASDEQIVAVGGQGVGISFDVPENTTVALVGESGSGKSVTAMSILNLLPENAQCQGTIRFMGKNTLTMPRSELQKLRGKNIACIFQDPMGSLNPVLTVGQQLCEPLRKHLRMSSRQARLRAEALLEEVGLPEPRRRLDSHPHQLSGGQQQRVMIAMALACSPQLLIADEPTTALDVTVQRQIIELLARLKERYRMSMLFISHDLDLVGEIADRVVVMRQGQIREQGPVSAIFTRPQDPYTQALLVCKPRLDETVTRLPVIDAPPPQTTPTSLARPEAPIVLEAVALTKSFWVRRGLWRRQEFQAVKNVSFQLRRGHTLGIVGESGSGKTTLGLALLGLHAPHSGPLSGRISFAGTDFLSLNARQMMPMRKRIQIVFQNPYSSLNPRFTAGQTLLEPMTIHRIGTTLTEREARAKELLVKVGLTPDAMRKYPHEFSGGQRQRLAIARCLTLNPDVLVLDEAVSALDVSVQAQVLNLLKDLQDELSLSYVFISHDLAVVRFMANDVLVMKDGAVLEHASSKQILQAPQHPYTQRLLAAVPKGWHARP